MSETTKAGWVSPPKLENGAYDKELIKKLYMESRHLGWTDFANSQGWNPQYTRQSLPVKSWFRSKKIKAAKLNAIEFDELNGDAIILRKKQILKTMKEYPEMCDRMKSILDVQLQDAQVEVFTARREKRPSKFTINDSAKLTSTIKLLAEAKKSALLITEQAARDAREPLNAAETAAAQDGPRGFVFQIGSKTATVEEMARETALWYDRPMADSEEPLKPIDVTPQNDSSIEVEKIEVDQDWYDEPAD